MSFMPTDGNLTTTTSKQDGPLDDWENVTEELQLAQIAEKQKQIVQRQVEEQQQKLPCTSATQDDNFPGSTNPMRPIRLLRRADNAQAKPDNSEENQAKLMTFEERQAAYQQARERIFGAAQPVNTSSSPPSTEVTASKTLTKAVLKAIESDSPNTSIDTSQPPTQTETLLNNDSSDAGNGMSEIDKQNLQNYLSDVQMVTTETAPLSSRRHYSRHTKPVKTVVSKPLTYGMPPPLPPGPFPSAMAILVQQAYASPPPQGQPITQPMSVPPKSAPALPNNQAVQQKSSYANQGPLPLSSCNPTMPPMQIANEQKNLNLINAEILVPRSVVGSVIGKGGATIKRLAFESGAWIQFAQDKDPNSAARQLNIQGNSQQIGRARQIISAFISTCSQATDNPSAESFCMSVPANKAGLVIGKGGDTIKQIFAETGAHVELNRDSLSNINEKVFLIKGTSDQIQHAQHVIKQKIGDLSPNSSASNLNSSNSPNLNSSIASTAYGLPAAQQQYQFGAPATAVWAQSNGQNATPWATQYIQQTQQHMQGAQQYYEFPYM
uniref:SUZ domain-containing protein n=1 Tax=Ditylenchus dipsaci TaxID=166011 RepID=A0A915CLI9_9BILA